MATRENTSREQLAREAFALVFSDALQARGLTLDRVHARLVAAGCPVSIATLSYWQTGRSLPTRMASMAALAELDRIFELPPGYLVSLLPARTDRSWRLRQVLDSYDRVEQIFAGWGSSTDSQLTSIVVHERHLVQDEGQRIVSRMRQLMRCTGDDVTTTPYIFQQPAAHVAPRPQALTAARSATPSSIRTRGWPSASGSSRGQSRPGSWSVSTSRSTGSPPTRWTAASSGCWPTRRRFCRSRSSSPGVHPPGPGANCAPTMTRICWWTSRCRWTATRSRPWWLTRNPECTGSAGSSDAGMSSRQGSRRTAARVHQN